MNLWPDVGCEKCDVKRDHHDVFRKKLHTYIVVEAIMDATYAVRLDDYVKPSPANKRAQLVIMAVLVAFTYCETARRIQLLTYIPN